MTKQELSYIPVHVKHLITLNLYIHVHTGTYSSMVSTGTFDLITGIKFY